jgi:hypothetical protein
VPRLVPPEPASAKSVSALVKRFVRKLTAWQIEPLVQQINKVQDAAIEATETKVEKD